MPRRPAPRSRPKNGARGPGKAHLRYLFDSYLLDTERRELWHSAGLVLLEPQVFDILEYLIRNREHVVSKDDLFASI